MTTDTSGSIRQLVSEVVHRTPVYDIHSHVYDPAFGELLLWGIDDLLTYHYLVAEAFRWLHAYSPYHQLRPAMRYPAMLMLSADSDDRVDPMHARKMTALLQAANNGSHPIILRIEKNAGTSQASCRMHLIDPTGRLDACVRRAASAGSRSRPRRRRARRR